MVWKTNFDQIPYQEFLESRHQKTLTGAHKSTELQQQQQQQPQKHQKQSDIHARLSSANNTAAKNERENSPLTIPTNESVNELDLITSLNNSVSHDVHQVKPNNKKLAFNANGNTNQPVVSAPSSNSNSVLSNANNNVPPNIAATLTQLVQQMDILTQVCYCCILRG